ncbi:MAG TPA: DUF305 domain-containing protein [Vicinamibacterales bacterium]|nr:DUF305 domain-containing protein [Vicinamibacterales bacterium]
MHVRSTGFLSTLLLAALVACRTAAPASSASIVRPGAPGDASRVEAVTPAAAPKHTDADVKFMQGMIGHHAQALEMTALLRSRSERQDMKMLALRIDVSQQDEIKMMQQWLSERGLEVPGPHAHHTGMLMPGMLTPGEMATLAAAKGAEFDKLFLAAMIKHHEGALVMVKELFDSPGAGQRAEIFAFASDVEADQSAEISRMRAMLATLK